MDFGPRQYDLRRNTKYAGARYRYMCFMQSRIANRKPLRRMVDFFLARTRDRMRSPYMRPLYWK